jgi:hypothetical protein
VGRVKQYLADCSAAGYAARLLRELTLGFTVWVQYEKPCPGKVGVAAPPFGRPSPDNPPGFPPQWLYVVGNEARGVPAFLVAGPNSVKYGRMAYQTYYSWGPDGPGLADRDRFRWYCLTLLAGISPQDAAAQIPESIRIFHWKGPAQYRADSANFLKSIRERVTRLRRALIIGGLLTAEESRSGPKFEVRALDQRANATALLPGIDWSLDR